MEFIEKLDGAVIVSDAEGNITYLNETAIRNFEKEGGKDLIGTNMFKCHNETSRQKLREMIEGREKNVYTIEKQGKKKLIYQTPWFNEGEFKGFVELSLEIPPEMPHFIRK